MEDIDFESLSVAESLVALSTSSLRISAPTDIPVKNDRKHTLDEDNYLVEDCSPTGVSDIWLLTQAYHRMRASSIASSSSESALDISESEGLPRSPSISEDSVPCDAVRYIGAYSPEARRKRIEKFLEKRKRRVWSKKVDYDVRKNFADSRLRVKGRFVKKEDEALLRDVMSYT